MGRGKALTKEQAERRKYVHKFGPPLLVGYITDNRCPLCGARLYTDRSLVWCSQVGEKHTCGYGIDSDIAVSAYGQPLEVLVGDC